MAYVVARGACFSCRHWPYVCRILPCIRRNVPYFASCCGRWHVGVGRVSVGICLTCVGICRVSDGTCRMRVGICRVSHHAAISGMPDFVRRYVLICRMCVRTHRILNQAAPDGASALEWPYDRRTLPYIASRCGRSAVGICRMYLSMSSSKPRA